MPPELIGQIPQLTGIVEKLGLVGVLLLAIGYLIWERLRLQHQLAKAFKQRDKARLLADRFRQACVARQIAVDTSDIDAMLNGTMTRMRSPWDKLIEDLEAGRRPMRIAWCAWAVAAWVAVAIVIALARPARAQLLSQEECRTFAAFALNAADVRDIGGDVERHVALLRERMKAKGGKLLPMVERELRRVYRERLPAAQAEQSAYTRCMSSEILRSEG